MKIGITCYPTYGGSGIVATELGLELALRGHEIHFISYAHPIRLPVESEHIHFHEVEVANYPLFAYPPYCLALAGRMAEVAERYGLDLLHVHYALPHAVSALLARQMLAPRLRLPFVTTLHGTDITLVGQEPSYYAITKYSIEASDGITTVSQYLNDRTREVFGVEKPMRTIHNFVNCELYHPRRGAEAGLTGPGNAGRRPRLLHISNFRPVKRPTDCIRVLKSVVERVDAELWMVGDGPERGPCERLARELGVSGRVEFCGKQDHIERLLPRADVLLLPSEHEAFGLAALEAMACGVPPVATRVGGVAELMEHGVDGYLEAVGDTEAQAGRVVELLSDPALYGRVSKAARLAAETRFDSRRIIPQYEQYYREVLGNFSAPDGV
ncbi:MAG: N-acetyl-alpha-D-glucosaminyl L-malate synthase BshA [Acidobacteria bacterium]|nr:N-acetyl-alpha-D-glucosaminyl L-malate synthase BshA [Acidobacteriota bacterium]